MNNARQIVAKLPTPVAGPSKLTTHSEVATIKYLQSNTSIPIPNILDWNDNPSNAIGSEYIIMEHALGVQLHRMWPEMSGPQQIACIKGISMNIKQMVELEFPAYGSLYFSDSILIDKNSKLSLYPDFCISPHCGTRYWDCNVGEIRYYLFKNPNRGPWPDITSYCSGLIDSGFSRLPPTSPDRKTLPSYQGSVVEHIQLLNSCRGVLNELVKDKRIINTSAPTLLHPDLHKRNIFVSEDDPTVVTGIIDWQSTSIEPAFYYAGESPDFATPEESKQTNAEMASICSQAFDACMKGLVPKLAASRAPDNNLLRVFHYCHRTWKDGAAVFKHELIQLAQLWEKLGLPGPCPYALPTPEEMSIYKNQFKCFEDARNLKQHVVEFLGTTSDGWVPNDVWNETKEAHMAVFEHMLQEIRAAQDSTFSAEDLVAMWPFGICMSKENDDDK